jgi:predicted ATP-grasp superfamily ATP-dependent carboligase
VDELSEGLPYPVIIKPRASSGSRGIARAPTPAILREEWRRINASFQQPLVQQLIPEGGEAYGISMLFNQRHEPRAMFSHRRIREYPRSGGPSTLREAVSLPELEAQTTSLLQSLRWFGVAMVEYKTDPRTQTPYLLEINPRFWGSIALAIHAGVDFPAMLYRLLTEGDIEPVFNYEIGARCRWLIGDFLHFLSIRPRVQGAMQLIRSLDRRTACDEINADDPWMGLGYLLSGAYQFVGEPKFRALLRGER